MMAARSPLPGMTSVRVPRPRRRTTISCRISSKPAIRTGSPVPLGRSFLAPASPVALIATGEAGARKDRPSGTGEPVRIAGLDEIRHEIVVRRRGRGTRTEVIPGNGDLAAIILVDHQLRVRIALRAGIAIRATHIDGRQARSEE